MNSFKETLLRELDDYTKIRRTMLLTPMESAQLWIEPDGKVKGPKKVLEKLLRKLRKPN